MKQSDLLADELQKLFNGSSWIDVNIMDTLTTLTAKQAASKPFANVNSIWEIVNHLVSWREAILMRIIGESIASPDNNFFEPIADRSEEAWKKALLRLEASQRAWINGIVGLEDDRMEIIWMPGNQSHYELISGILQHDAYHLGQIVILKKFV